MNNRADQWDRRKFLRGAALSGTTGLVGLRPGLALSEPPPETSRVRLPMRLTLCEAPQYVAEELLRLEGFREIQYLKRGFEAVVAGEADITMIFSPDVLVQIDTGAPVVFLAGVHIGCIEVFAGDRVRTFHDLKGKTVVIWDFGDSTHLLLAIIAAHVGLKPDRDINWTVNQKVSDWPRLLAEGKIDAFLGFPPLAQETRAKKIGHVVLNSLTDRPWSQYFCCMVAANKDFVRRYPVATKRALRAILKASNVCAVEPERVAKLLVDRGYRERSDYAVQAMKEVVYGKWREYEPEEAVRFYALRLHEAGLIKSSPQKIIAQGTDWRFLNELKKELKG